jgi:hypothetical protein
MLSFAAAYLIVLLAVVLYVARLGIEQRRLARDLEFLRIGEVPARDDQSTIRAA